MKPLLPVIFLIILYILVVGCISSNTANDNNTSGINTSTQIPIPTVKPAPLYSLIETPTINLIGNGSQMTEIRMDQGMVIIAVNYSGEGNFAYTLRNKNPHIDDVRYTPVNVSNSYSDSRVVIIGEHGDYLLDIKTNNSTTNSWIITIKQAGSESSAFPPQTYSGHGNQVVGPIRTYDPQTFTWLSANNDQSNFTVSLKDDHGNNIVTIINNRGPSSGSQPFHIWNQGYTYIEVICDGDWTLKVS